VTTIGRSAFADVRSTIAEIDIVDSITTISQLAFSNCIQLKSITIGQNVTMIGDKILIGCNSLESIVVLEGHPKYHSAGNCLIETATKTLIAGCKNSVIPVDGSVTKIGASAFQENAVIEYLAIPYGVTEIGEAAFNGDTALSSIILPSSIQRFGAWAFFQCGALKNIYFDGTKAEWQAIEKGPVWDYGTSDYTIHCSDGTIEKRNVEESGSRDFF